MVLTEFLSHTVCTPKGCHRNVKTKDDSGVAVLV